MGDYSHLQKIFSRSYMRTLDLECVKKVRDNQEIDVTPMGRN